MVLRFGLLYFRGKRRYFLAFLATKQPGIIIAVFLFKKYVIYLFTLLHESMHVSFIEAVIMKSTSVIDVTNLFFSTAMRSIIESL